MSDPSERKKFAIAAYNAGEGRIAKAQALAIQDGKDPTKWSHVKQYLEAAGATPKKNKEIQDYVESVSGYESEFAEKSPADKKVKLGKPRSIKKLPVGGHWITLNGIHIFIEDKK